MKKWIGILSFLIVSLAGGNATYAQQSGFGIRAGVNTSYFGENSYFDKNALYGYHAGIYGKFGITPSFTIQPELLYSRKGTGSLGHTNVSTAGEESVFANYRHQLDYLDLPLLLRFNITRGLHFMAGPQFSYLMWSRQNFTGVAGEEIITTEQQRANRFDYAALLGFGYEWASGLNLGVRYGYGFGRVYNTTEFINKDPRNIVGQFTLGYTIGGRGDL